MRHVGRAADRLAAAAAGEPISRARPSIATAAASRIRAIRFSPGEVHLLLPDGDRRIDWSDLAELHLPAADPWTPGSISSLQLCPNIDTRLYEIETTGGLVATASLARLAMRFEGNSAESDRWVHGIQPAWSLDILWVPFREIAFVRSFAPREVPLSRIAPRHVASAAVWAARKRSQINRNVLGGPLRSKTLDFGWGLGVRGRRGAGASTCPLGVRSLRALGLPRPRRGQLAAASGREFC